MKTQEILENFCNDKKHAEDVRDISAIIFDEVDKNIKKMSPKQKNYLEKAALLHDIGYSVSSKKHNKYSQKLILDNDLDNFTQREREIISCIARYHRGGLPNKKEHEIYCHFDKKERKIVKRLGGILRIADSLNKNHICLIKDIKIKFDEINNITEFYLVSKNVDYRPEINFTKKDLFEKGFKTQVVFKFEA